MIDGLDIADGFSVKCVCILNKVIFIDAALNISLINFENAMFYDFIYLFRQKYAFHLRIDENCY